MTTVIVLILLCFAYGGYLKHRQRRLYKMLVEHGWCLFMPAEQVVTRLRSYGVKPWEISWLLEHRREVLPWL